MFVEGRVISYMTRSEVERVSTWWEPMPLDNRLEAYNCLEWNSWSERSWYRWSFMSYGCMFGGTTQKRISVYCPYTSAGYRTVMPWDRYPFWPQSLLVKPFDCNRFWPQYLSTTALNLLVSKPISHYPYQLRYLSTSKPFDVNAFWLTFHEDWQVSWWWLLINNNVLHLVIENCKIGKGPFKRPTATKDENCIDEELIRATIWIKKGILNFDTR